MQDENRITATIRKLLHETPRDKGDKYGGEREIRQRTGECASLLVLFLIREKWK